MIPVTLLAAEKLPIFSGRSSWERRLERGEVDLAVVVLRDRDEVRNRFAPRQLVGVVLVRADEHDRPLARRDPRRQVVAVVEIGRQAEVQDVDELVDRARGARAAEDHRVIRRVRAQRRSDDLAGLLAEARRLEPRPG
jgi:hypothetical protein